MNCPHCGARLELHDREGIHGGERHCNTCGCCFENDGKTPREGHPICAVAAQGASDPRRIAAVEADRRAEEAEERLAQIEAETGGTKPTGRSKINPAATPRAAETNPDSPPMAKSLEAPGENVKDTKVSATPSGSVTAESDPSKR